MPDSRNDSASNTQKEVASVPKLSTALEKYQLGPSRIISGIVADALSLVRSGSPKPVISILLLRDETFTELWKVVLDHLFDGRCGLQFAYFSRASELVELVQRRRFDLVVLYFSNVNWDIPDSDPFDVFASLKLGKRIIVTQGMDLSRKCEKAGCAFLEAPFTLGQFGQVVRTCMAPMGITVPRRIVVVDEYEGTRKSYRAILGNYFNTPKCLDFFDGNLAWAELSRFDPDLLITDVRHPGLNGLQLLERLAERKATFPIFLISFFDESLTAKWLAQRTSEGLKLDYLMKPWIVWEIEHLLQIWFGPSDNPKYKAASAPAYKDD